MMKYLVLLGLIVLSACQSMGGDQASGYVTKTEQITGVEWKLYSVSSKGKIIKPLKGHTPTLSFRKDGLVKGYSGLNKFFGRFILSPSTRTINLGSGFGKEHNQGSEALYKQEFGYMKALKGKHEIYRHDDELYLNNQDKKIVLLFKK